MRMRWAVGIGVVWLTIGSAFMAAAQVTTSAPSQTGCAGATRPGSMLPAQPAAHEYLEVGSLTEVNQAAREGWRLIIVYFGLAYEGFPQRSHYVLERPIESAGAPGPTRIPTGAGVVYGGRDLAAWVRELRDLSQTALYQACPALAAFGSDAVPAIVPLLQDPAAGVRRNAALALRSLGADAAPAVPELIEALQDQDGGVRRAAAVTLWAIGEASRPAIPALTDALGDPDRQVRLAALSALAKFGAESLPLFVRALSHADPQVRCQAASEIGQLGGSARDAAEALTRALEDPDPSVRVAAGQALLQVQAPR